MSPCEPENFGAGWLADPEADDDETAPPRLIETEPEWEPEDDES